MPRSRFRLLLLLIPVLAGASLLLNRLARQPEPSERQVVSSGPVRCVVDLLRVPTSAECTLVGTREPLPGRPTRWIEFRLAGGHLLVGWAGSAEAQADPALDLPGGKAVRVAAWPSPQESDVIGVDLICGWTPDAKRERGRVVVTMR